MELSSGAPCAPQEPNHEGESTSVTSLPLEIQATPKQEDSSSVMSLPLDFQATSKQEDSHSVTSLPLAFQATSKQEESNSVMSLPLEILHRLLSHCSIPDVLSFAQALGRPELIEV